MFEAWNKEQKHLQLVTTRLMGAIVKVSMSVADWRVEMPKYLFSFPVERFILATA